MANTVAHPSRTSGDDDYRHTTATASAPDSRYPQIGTQKSAPKKMWAEVQGLRPTVHDGGIVEE